MGTVVATTTCDTSVITEAAFSGDALGTNRSGSVSAATYDSISSDVTPTTNTITTYMACVRHTLVANTLVAIVARHAVLLAKVFIPPLNWTAAIIELGLVVVDAINAVKVFGQAFHWVTTKTFSADTSNFLEICFMFHLLSLSPRLFTFIFL